MLDRDNVFMEIMITIIVTFVYSSGMFKLCCFG